MASQDHSQELARETAGLLSVADTSQTRALNQLVELAPRLVSACSGAASALWQDGEPILLAASHPDLAALLEVQLKSERGPTIDALQNGGPVVCPDTLDDLHWPEFAHASLCRGVRCSVTLQHEAPPLAITLTLYAARPRVLDPEQIPLAELLVAVGGAVMSNASIYGDARRMAIQMHDAVEARAVVDQARGLLMHRLGCDSQGALNRMREVSQTHHVKMTDVARKIIRAHETDVS